MFVRFSLHSAHVAENYLWKEFPRIKLMYVYARISLATSLNTIEITRGEKKVSDYKGRRDDSTSSLREISEEIFSQKVDAPRLHSDAVTQFQRAVNYKQRQERLDSEAKPQKNATLTHFALISSKTLQVFFFLRKENPFSRLSCAITTDRRGSSRRRA